MVCVEALALSEEFELGEDFRAIFWVLCAISDLFLILAIEYLEFILFQPLHSNDLTDRLLLALATFKESTRDKRGEKAPILLCFFMSDIEAIDEEHSVLGLIFLIVLYYLPVLQI